MASSSRTPVTKKPTPARIPLTTKTEPVQAAGRVAATTGNPGKSGGSPARRPTSVRTPPSPPVDSPTPPVSGSASSVDEQLASTRSHKAKKPKMVRDSFTIPKAEYATLDELKKRTVRLAAPAKKSELLRAGIMALASMDDAGFMASLRAVPTIKTGRPAKAD